MCIKDTTQNDLLAKQRAAKSLLARRLMDAKRLAALAFVLSQIMTGPETKLAKKRGRPSTGAGKTLGLRFHPHELAPIDEYAADASLTRQQAIRMILADWLQTHGYEAGDNSKQSGHVVEAMDAAIKGDRFRRKGSPTE